MVYAKSKETRAQLLKGTGRLLRTKGYAATGVSAIVKETGVPKGSVYHHFPGGKEELAAASVERSGQGIVGALEQLADRTGGPVEAMRAFCDYYIAQLHESDFRRGCPLATITLEVAADVDPVHEACAVAFDGIVDLFATRLRGAGLSRKRANESAELTVAAIEGALMLAKARRDTRAIEIVRDELSRTLKEQIRGAKRRKK